MHDDVPLTLGRVKRVLTERIRPAIHGDAVALTVEAHQLPGEPIPPAEGLQLDFEPYEVGTLWGPAWSTTWFKLTGQVPAEWAGRTVEAVVDLGFDINMPGFQCEGLVYTPDLQPVKSLNPRNQWLRIADEAEGGETVELYLEAAANPVLLDYHPFLPTQEGDIKTSSPRKLYTTRRMDLAVFNAEVFELSVDLNTLYELVEELPEGPRRGQILAALDASLDHLDLQDIAGTAGRARAELEGVLSASAHDSAHTISAIGHAHIDSAWLWPVRETIRKAARTSSTMVELIGQTDDFLFGMSSAQQYKWIKEHRPEVYAKVKQAVADGRFIPLGGMWVESDTTMPSGESLVRQFLYGQRFFQTEFGIRCRGVWLPDSFGYSPALPQLMRRAGFEWFFTQKISWNQVNKFPHHTFNWEGIDGSRVFTHFPSMDTYNAQLSGSELARASRQFREHRTSSSSIAPTGWGDGGGGTTREMVGAARRSANLDGNPRVKWEHPDDFYERARAELPEPPVWVGELYLELHRATLTSQHATKSGNRRGEHLLVEAELWAAAAAVRAGVDYPYDELDSLWETILLHQFHDILPGTSIAWVHREAAANYQRVAEAAASIIARSIAALAGEGTTPVAANAAPVPAAIGGVQVPAGAVVVLDQEHSDAPATISAEADGLVLSNGVVTVRLDAAGHVVSAVDEETGRDAIVPGERANLLRLHQDFPNMWDAWDVDRFYRNTVTVIDSADSVEHSVRADGTAEVIIKRSFSKSTVTQTLTLAPGSRTLQIAQETDWHETEKFLKSVFPLNVWATESIAETQFGVQKRPTHTNTSWEAAKFETSMHRFVLVQEEGFGAALINDNIYGFDVTRDSGDGVTTTVGLSLLRAPRFPDPETDLGLQHHRFGLVIGAGIAEATAEANLLNTPAQELTADPERAAELGRALVEVGGVGVLRSSVKLAADRSGDLVVRVYESLGRRTTAEVQIDTPVQAVDTVSLLEEVTEDAPALRVSLTEGGAAVGFDLKPFEVTTLRIRRA